MNYTGKVIIGGMAILVASLGILNGQMVYTANAVNVTATSATLYGGLNNFSAPASIWFQYSQIGNSTVSTVAGTRQAFSDSQNYSDSAQISGLTPYALYEYQIVVLTGADTLYGNYSGFYTGANPVITAGAAGNITTSSATLNGNVSDAPPGSQVYFQFWTGNNFPTLLAATPPVVSDTLSHAVSTTINGLLPYTWYNYSVNVMDSVANWQSGTVQFYTGTGSPYYVNTLPASNVTSISATLNGVVGNLPFTSSLYFDYWTPGNSHTSIAASPSTVSDTNQHVVSSDIAGLSPNTTYWFRLEAVDSLSVRYGDSTALYTGTSGIPNFDFENWSTVSGQKPVGWINIFGPVIQVSPGYSGNYAVKLQHTAAGIGALVNGYPNLNSGNGNSVPYFYGGVPYNVRPDTLTGMFEYDIVPGDTAYALIQFKSQGQVIAAAFDPITGSSPGNYRQLKFPVSYTSSATPDTVVVGIIPTNVNGNQNIIGSWIIADSLAFQGSYPPIPNGGFENWQSFSFTGLDQWNYMDMYDWGVYANPDSECVIQSADAEHGNYAAQISNIPFMGSWILGNLGTASLMNSGNTPSFPVNHAVQSLNGWYQFYPVNGDTFVAGCQLFYQGNPVGGGFFSTTRPANSYTQFSVNVSYYNNWNGVPDSATIIIQTFSSVPQGSSRALVDNLSFDGFASAIQPDDKGNNLSEDIQVYPNPSTGKFTVTYPVREGEPSRFEIMDIAGRTVYSLNNNGGDPGKKEFELSALCPGVYIINIHSGAGARAKKLVIQR